MPATYTVQFTFNRAKNLPVADLSTLSSDPYVLASLEVPDGSLEPLTYRTPTLRRTRDPEWNATWIVSGVPSSGIKLVMQLYDEDPGEPCDDRLGKAVARFGPEQMKEGFESPEREYTLQKRKGDLHPYILTYVTALLPGQKLRKHNRVVLSAKVLGKSKEHADDRRMYTVGPNRYSRHFSPLIGSMVNKAGEPDANDNEGQKDGRGSKLSATTFIANKIQLTGPVPRELRHRYVGYKPFINWMFTKSGIAGRILNHGLRRQYRTIYACDKSTVWGVVDDTDADPGKSSPESTETLARQFLDMTAWGEGAKLFTYVITLDGEWRFTETGPEFAVDLLSKHSMHADLAKEIAYSGEFFVRPTDKEKARKEQQKREGKENETDTRKEKEDGNQKSESRDEEKSGEAPKEEAAKSQTPLLNPKDYELIIDNDSGTYRPKKELLPILEKWLSDPRELGGLGAVHAMDGFDKDLEKMKEERKKEKEGLQKGAGKRMIPVRKGSSVSSISRGEIGTSSVSSAEVKEALKKSEAATGAANGKASA